MKKFKKAYIEITNVCNLSCNFCPKSNRKPQFMTIELFEKILIQLQPHTKYIYFHVKGEPLLHPELDEFLKLSEIYGYKVNLTTNGTLINKCREKLIKSASLRQINFSLHSFDANEKNSSLEDYINSILDFTIEASLNTKIISALRLWNLSENYETNISSENNDPILKLIEERFNLDFNLKAELLEGRGLKLSKNIYLNPASKFNWPDIKTSIDNNIGFCHGLRDQAAILADGTVVPCCLDGEGIINLGNINNEDFKSIIESARANAIYDGFSNRKVVEPLCQKCDYRRRFS